MSRPPQPLPAQLLGRTFTVAEARTAGVSSGRLRTASLRAPFRGVRSTADPAEHCDIAARCRELAPLLPPGAVFNHATALHLLDVDRPFGLRRAGDLHVQVAEPASGPRRAGVVGHSRTERRVPVLRAGQLPVLAPGLVWAQLAGELSADELVVLGDAMLRRRRRRRRPRTTMHALTRTVQQLPTGARGVRRLRAALPLLRGRTDSCRETRLRPAVIGAGLPCPQVNRPVHDDSGRYVAMPDLAYPDLRVAIEYDGDIHRTDRSTWRRDIARRRSLEAIGWWLITCTADDVRAPAQALAWICTTRTEQLRRGVEPAADVVIQTR